MRQYNAVMNSATRDTEPATYTVEEMRARLKISRSLAYEAIRSGDIPSIRVGKRILIPRVQLERLLAGER
jgi:excisionase family DNA binding protein